MNSTFFRPTPAKVRTTNFTSSNDTSSFWKNIYSRSIEQITKNPSLNRLILEIAKRDPDGIRQLLEENTTSATSKLDQDAIETLILSSNGLLPASPIEFAFDLANKNPEANVAHLYELIKHRQKISELTGKEHIADDWDTALLKFVESLNNPGLYSLAVFALNEHPLQDKREHTPSV